MDFYMKLAKKIGLKEFQVGSNFLFSPLSIHAVLSMLAAGSSGRTLKQILSLLKSERTHDLNAAASQLIRLISSEGTREKDDPVLAMVNGIWVDKSFSLTPSFKETMNTIFRAEAKEVDFQTKSVVEVNEDGAEAAAVTVVGVLRTSSGRRRYRRPERIDFVADHPFMFMIREDVKGVVLFVGSVIDPSKNQWNL
ncbi:hypothetical protein AAC387_Pa03g3356 [Persea americana]